MKVVYLFVAALLFASVGGMAHAQQLDQTFKKWSVFSTVEGGKTICYIASSPTSEKGNFSKRGEAHVWVMSRGKNVDEVSATSGFPYKDKADVIVEIGNKQYKLFSQGDTAWTKDVSQDRALVTAMKKGSSMVVRGSSQKNTHAKDGYSLSGFSAAYNRMKALCAK